MLSCKDVTKAISSDQELSFFARIEVKLHLLMCVHCRAYFAQLRKMKSGFTKLLHAKQAEVDNEKIRELEDKIIKKIGNDRKN